MIDVSNVANLPTRFGNFKIQSFKENDKEHLVIFTGNLCDIPVVRVHSECLTGDTIGSLKCDCRDQLEASLKYVYDSKCGMVLYLRQEGRGIGLFNKVNAYNLQDKGLDTVEANHQLGFLDDYRDFSIADYIFEYFGIKEIRLLTNNPRKLSSLKVNIVERIPLIMKTNDHNENYLKTKKEKSGHLL
jgi:GTP cyclohydrolase II